MKQKDYSTFIFHQKLTLMIINTEHGHFRIAGIQSNYISPLPFSLLLPRMSYHSALFSRFRIYKILGCTPGIWCKSKRMLKNSRSRRQRERGEETCSDLRIGRCANNTRENFNLCSAQIILHSNDNSLSFSLSLPAFFFSLVVLYLVRKRNDYRAARRKYNQIAMYESTSFCPHGRSSLL